MSQSLPPSTAVAALSRYRAHLLLYGALAALTLCLGLSRLAIGPWFHVYHPWETSLLEGRPVSWEAVYYTDQLPTFTGNGATRFGFAPVHYRTLLPLYLSAALYAWTGSAYWSFAATDLLFWFVAGVASYHLSRRLGASPWAGALASLLLVASPLLISHMWRHDLHPANFASMTLAVWSGVVLVDEHRRPWALTIGLGLLLLISSLCYQYQWVLAPLLLIRCVTAPRLGWLRGAAVVAAAVAIYALGTAGLDALFRVAVGPPTEWNYVASQPGSMIAERVRAVRTVADAVALLPGPYYFEELWRSYDPALLLCGLIGVVLLGWRVALMTLAGLAIALVSLTYYSAPWAATTTYPLIYAGAGVTCVALGRLIVRIPLAPRMAGTPLSIDVDRQAIALAVAVAVAVLLALPPNQDLFGRTGFLLTWWSYFAARYLF